MSGAPEVNREGRLRGLIAAFLAMFTVTLLIALAGILYTVVSVRDTQVSRIEVADATKKAADAAAHAAEDAARSAQRIEDCTTPGRKCFEDGQKRVSKAVDGVNEATLTVIVAAISCQDDGITDQKALARCTVERAASK